MTQKDKKSVSILLPIELYAPLLELAKEDHRPLSSQIRQIIKWYLQNQNGGTVCAVNAETGNFEKSAAAAQEGKTVLISVVPNGKSDAPKG